MIVGKQIAIPVGLEGLKSEVKVEGYSSNENIDELIEMNYSN